MTSEERTRLRKLQDRWLALPVVQHQIRNHGAGEHIAGPDSPTYEDVRKIIYPAWREWFNDFFM